MTAGDIAYQDINCAVVQEWAEKTADQGGTMIGAACKHLR